MTLPASGNMTSEQGRAEYSLALPMTSAQLGAAAGLGSAYSSGGLYGKSARTVSIFLSGNNVMPSGQQGQYNQYIFSISVSDGAAVTSRAWSGDLSYVSGATGVFESPVYNPQGFTYQANGTIYCTVVVAGTTYNVQLAFQYETGDPA